MPTSVNTHQPRTTQTLKEPFQPQNKLNLRAWLVILTIVSLHLGLLLYNFIHIPRTYGYDWPGHFTYLFYVAEHWQVPSATITPQFFNPPLYYFAVAAFSRITTIPLVSAGLVFNILLAILTLILLIDIARRTLKNHIVSLILFLGLYISIPTIYRAYGMMRPEAMLIPLFTAAAWIAVITTQSNQIRWHRLAAATGLVAGLAVGVRQWGVFLEIALILWLIIIYWQTSENQFKWRLFISVIALQATLFSSLFLFFYLGIREGNVTAFNVDTQLFEPVFLTRLELKTLFSNPIRPQLNYRFWPTLYADFWGDYWRYWRESSGDDTSPISLINKNRLVLAMWAGLMPTGLIAVGLIRLYPKKKRLSTNSLDGLTTLAWLIIGVTFAGYLVFASRYAVPDKGDTVKSIYIVYLVPFVAWIAGQTVPILSKYKGMDYYICITIGALFLFVLPNSIYLSAPGMFGRVWEKPVVQHTIQNTLDGTYTLVGYDLNEAHSQQQLTLIWHADQYSGKPYKVFVQLFDPTGQLIAQSDAVPANWGRATQSWMLGEYVIDSHILADAPDHITDDYSLVVGMYNESTGQRLLSDKGADHIVLSPFKIGE